MKTIKQEIDEEFARLGVRSSFPTDILPVNKLAALNMQKGKEPENDLEKWKQEVEFLQKTLKQVKCTPKTSLREQQIRELGLRIQKAVQRVHKIKEQLGMTKKPVSDLHRCFTEICRQNMPANIYNKYMKMAHSLAEERTNELLKNTETKN